jgi:hypothetical protein
MVSLVKTKTALAVGCRASISATRSYGPRLAFENRICIFPDYDLLNEIDSCELGILLKKLRKGEITASTPAQFRPVFERFCERYNARPSRSMGAFPFDVQWDFAEGWKMKQS